MVPMCDARQSTKVLLIHVFFGKKERKGDGGNGCARSNIPKNRVDLRACRLILFCYCVDVVAFELERFVRLETANSSLLKNQLILLYVSCFQIAPIPDETVCQSCNDRRQGRLGAMHPCRRMACYSLAPTTVDPWSLCESITQYG